MTWFIFIGDMLVMLFMTLLVVWVSTSSSRATLDFSAQIPLHDDATVVPDTGNKQEQTHG